MPMRSWVLGLVLFAVVCALPQRAFRPSSFPPEELTLSSADDEHNVTRWFRQTLDHFDGEKTVTWNQRYFVNDTFFDGSGPVFVCVGGEGPALAPTVVITGDAHCALMVTLAQEHKALIVAVEHRFYGESLPTPDFTTENLRYLSSQQALADLATLHAEISRLHKLSKSNKWVSFGGSYPGMMAWWFHMKYPHLVHATVASSAPVRAQVDMVGYNDVVAASMAEEDVGGSKACAAAIRDASAQMGELLGSTAGAKKLETMFNVCAPGSLRNKDNMASFAEGTVEGMFPVQGNDPACTTSLCNIARQCEAMLDTSVGDPLERLAKMNEVRRGGRCINVDYEKDLEYLRDTTLEGGTGRIWFYQTCAEFAFYQTCEADSDCIFVSSPPLNTLERYENQCEYAFNISATQIRQHVDFSNEYYGADHPEGSRVLFVSGSVDPWRALSINEELSPSMPFIWVDGASHHAWTHPVKPTDQATVVEARKKISAWVAKWLSE